jgi:hypothetical protein
MNRAIFHSKGLYNFLDKHKETAIMYYKVFDDTLSFGYMSEEDSIYGHAQEGKDEWIEYDKKQWARLRKTIRFIPEQPLTLRFENGGIVLNWIEV